MKSRTTKLTKRYVDALSADQRRSDLKVFDTEVRGFGVRVRTSGRRSFFVQYRNASGRTRRMAIGQYGQITVDQARKRAMELLGSVAGGKDPLQERKLARSRGMLFKELAADYLQYLDQPGRSRRGLTESRRLVEKQLVPVLGKRRWREITPSDVQALHRRLRETPVEANRVVSRLSTVLRYGQRLSPESDWTNPCIGITKYPERRRERFLSTDEFARLGKALNDAEQDGESPVALAGIRLLMLTGARLREILELRWEHIDFEHRCLRLPTSKTGQKVVPIGEAAITELRGLEKVRQGPWVFPGGRKGRPLGNLWRPWKALCKRAELRDVRLHDLRHSFASVGVGGGLSLPVVGAALGHRSPSTTQRYAHLAEHPVRHGVEQTSSRIEELLRGQISTELL